MGLKEMLGIKKPEVKKLNKGLLDIYQCRCVGRDDDKDCPFVCELYGHDWCGVSPLINYKCPQRRQPEG